MVIETLSPGSSSASAYISNVTGTAPAAPYGYNTLSDINISVITVANISINMTESYPCNIPPEFVSPFKYIAHNSTWMRITPFIVNAATCTIEFTVPKDPLIGIFSNYTAPTSTTILQTTTVPATVITTTIQSAPPSKSSTYYYIIILVVAVALVIIYLIASRKRGRYSKGLVRGMKAEYTRADYTSNSGKAGQLAQNPASSETQLGGSATGN